MKKKYPKSPTFVSLLSLASAAVAIYFFIQDNLRVGVCLLLLCVVFDYLDGKVARKFKRTSEFGKEIDSLVDIFSFGAAPVVFGLVQNDSVFALISYVLFLSAGVVRLAKFNVQEVKGMYFGMPITMNGIIIPLIYFVGLNTAYFPYVYIISAVLMVTPFKIKKFI